MALLIACRASAALERPDASQALHTLFDKEWNAELAEDPLWASVLGNYEWNQQWPDESAEGAARREALHNDALRKLRLIDRSQLPPFDQVNYDLFENRYQTAIAEDRFRYHLFPSVQASTILRHGELATSLRFECLRDFDDWITRMKRFPVYIQQVIAVLREGSRRGLLPPQVVMKGLLTQLQSELGTNALQDQFYGPFQNLPLTISPEDRVRLQKEASAVIAADVVPQYTRFREFLAIEYVPSCSDVAGIGGMIQGQELYTFLVRKFTTTGLSPREIHDIGLDEVERIRFEMESVRTQVGFRGTLRRFSRHLQVTPRFHYNSSDALLNAYRATAKRIDPEVIKLFHKLPRTPYGIAAMPTGLAANAPAAFYRQGAVDGSRPGMVFVNLSQPKQRQANELLVVLLHEGVPGHHLQMSLQHELGEMPSFRRFTSYSAFAEGWALYAESLGEDLGLYDDPYDKFGRLQYEMLRAVRLVIDTGLHEFGWTRPQAIAYFMENTGKPSREALVEIDRYINSPGQALAYKVGELRIQELRSKANKELGSNFDLRSFNDVVLSMGSVPLDILEKQVDAWIKDQKPNTVH